MEFILCHAEISIVFVEETKISEVHDTQHTLSHTHIDSVCIYLYIYIYIPQKIKYHVYLKIVSLQGKFQIRWVVTFQLLFLFCFHVLLWNVVFMFTCSFSFQVLKTFPNTSEYVKSKSFSFSPYHPWLYVFMVQGIDEILYAAIVSFGKVKPEEKEAAEKFGLAMYSWQEFLCMVHVIV